MASSMNTCILLLVAITTSYFSHAVTSTNTNITSIALNGKVYCNTNGNPSLSCGGTSCPPAVNAIVTLAVQYTNIVAAQTATSTSGLFSFNLTYNATNTPPFVYQNIPNVVAYVSLPVTNCTALSGAGILVGFLPVQTNFTAGGLALTFTPPSFIRF